MGYKAVALVCGCASSFGCPLGSSVFPRAIGGRERVLLAKHPPKVRPLLSLLAIGIIMDPSVLGPGRAAPAGASVRRRRALRQLPRAKAAMRCRCHHPSCPPPLASQACCHSPSATWSASLPTNRAEEPVKQRTPPKLSVHCPVEVKQSVSKDAGGGARFSAQVDRTNAASLPSSSAAAARQHS